MGWDWPTACMVTPLGCKNVLSPSNQVSVLISCTSHKQISEPYPFCSSLVPFIVRTLCLTKLNYGLTLTIYGWQMSDVLCPTVIFASVLYSAACSYPQVYRHQDMLQKVGVALCMPNAFTFTIAFPHKVIVQG